MRGGDNFTKPGKDDFSRNGFRSLIHLQVPATADVALPSCRSFSPPRARVATLQLLQPGGGGRSGAASACSQRRHVPRSANPIRPGFCRPPRSRSGAWRRRGLRGPGGEGEGERERAECGGGGEGRTAHARRRGRGRPAPPAPSGRNPRAAARPGAARSRPRPDPRRPGGACSLGRRPRARGREGTFLALPARLRPFPLPLPPPPRVFRPSKDRATQISLGRPLPSGPFSGRVSGAAESLVFSPKWKVSGAGGGGGRLGPLPTAPHARIVVSKIKLTSARGEKDRSLLFSCSPPAPLPCDQRQKNIFFFPLEGGGEDKKGGKNCRAKR